VTLKNSGMDLPSEQVDNLLARWKESRRQSAVGYLSSAVDIQTHGYSPADLTLVEARAFQVQEVSRMVGIPAYYLATDTGSSMTYAGAAVSGNKNGYCGLGYASASGTPALMFGTSSQYGGIYFEGTGTWALYWDGTQWQQGNTSNRVIPVATWSSRCTMSRGTAAPSGGVDGDLYYQYT
jgi:hypothetical protein